MSERFLHSDYDCERRSRESMHSYQSVWMAHWKRVECDATGQGISASGNNESICDIKQRYAMSQTEIASGVPRPSKNFADIQTRAFEMLNESVKTGTERIEELGHQSFLAAGAGSSCIPSAAAAPAAAKISLREYHSQPEEKSAKPMEEVNTRAFFSESSFAASRPLQENYSLSASDMVPYRSGHGSNRFKFGRNEISSFKGDQFLCSKDQLPTSNLKRIETERSDYHSHSAHLLGTKSMNDHTSSGKSIIPYFRQNKMPLLLNNPSGSDSRSTEIGSEHLKVQNFSQCSSPELTRSEKLHHGSQFFRKLPHSLHDLETMRICTGVDSVVGISGGYPRFSPASGSLLITKKTDVNFGKEKKVFKNVTLASVVTGKTFLNMAPSLFISGQQGVKIQSLGSSTDSELKENIEDLKASEVNLKNESSAETDIMDVDSFKENHILSGIHSCPQNKAIKVDSSQFPVVSSRLKNGRKHVNSEIPDINLEISDVGNMKDSAEPSSSRTQSFDINHMLNNAVQENYSMSNHCPDNFPGGDQSGRLFKRLRLCPSGSLGFGLRSSNVEDLSSKKVSKPYNMTTPELEEGNYLGKEMSKPDKPTTLLRKFQYSSVDRAKSSKDLLLSQSWIRRWLHNPAEPSQKQTDAVVLCAPQSSKLMSDEFQKKQFPSIAAMALMGKAVNGFQPCQFQNRGSFVVWKTKGIYNNHILNAEDQDLIDGNLQRGKRLT